MMRVLLTGFEPFGEMAGNPSSYIVNQIATPESVSELTVFGEVLPTEYGHAGRRICDLIRDVDPEAVICLGVSAQLQGIALERVAINVDDCPKPDNSGEIRAGSAIDPDGPAAYLSTLPLHAMRDALEAGGIPVTISNHAGTFVCNHVFYQARQILTALNRNIPCGFIHVPLESGVSGSAGLPLSVMVNAIQQCIEFVSGQTRPDPPDSQGTS